MIQISDRSDEIHATGIELSGGAWNKKAIGIFSTKELENDKLFYWCNTVLLNRYTSLSLKP